MVRSKGTARLPGYLDDDSPFAQIFPDIVFGKPPFNMCRRMHRELDTPAKRMRSANSQQWDLVCLDTHERCAGTHYGTSNGPIPFIRADALKELVRLLRPPVDGVASAMQEMDLVPIKPILSGKRTKRPGPFVMLPPELQTMVSDYLEDFDFIFLCLANSYFFNLGNMRLKRMVERRTAGAWIGRSIAVMGSDAPFEYNTPHQIKVHGRSTSLTYPELQKNNILMPYERNNMRKAHLRSLISQFKPSSYGNSRPVSNPKVPIDREAKIAIIKEREKTLTSQIKSKAYPRAVTDVLQIILDGEPLMRRKPKGSQRRRVIKQYDPNLRRYVVRNLTKKEYIEYGKSGDLSFVIRDSANLRWSRQGDATCNREIAALSAFLITIKWGGEPTGAPLGDPSFKKLTPGFYQGMWAGDTFDIVERKKPDLEGWKDVSDIVYEGVIEEIRTFWPDSLGLTY